jgi:hypothetical protein
MSSTVCVFDCAQRPNDWLTIEQCTASELRLWKLYPTGPLSFWQSLLPNWDAGFHLPHLCLQLSFLFYSKTGLRLFLLKNIQSQEYISLNTSHIKQCAWDNSLNTYSIERRVWDTSLGISSIEPGVFDSVIPHWAPSVAYLTQ